MTQILPEKITAPSAGFAGAILFWGTVGGGQNPLRGQLRMLTLIVVLPVLPVASRTVALRLTAPFAVPVVIHGIETGPRLDVTWLPRTCPLTEIVKVFDVPLWPSTHKVGHTVPVTVPPFCGWVTNTRSVPVGDGDGDDVTVLATVTVRVAVEPTPAASRTVRLSVCAALLAAVVFHA